MTLRYAAPEQILNHPVTTATDVFGLGALLYEVLSGCRIRDEKTLDLSSIRNEKIASPGELLRRPPTDSASPTAALSWRRIPADLDNICLMALRPEPERRYASADLLGQEVERLLAGQPVAASGDTLGYRVRKFLRRNRKGVIAGVLLVAFLALGFIRERSLRDRALTEAMRANAVSDFLGTLITSADPANARGREVTVEEVLSNAETTLAANERMASQPEVEAEPLQRKVVDRRVEVLGSDHHQTGMSMHNLGSLLLRLGRYEEAEGWLRRAVAPRSRQGGAGYLYRKSSLADALRELHRLPGAEALYLETLDQQTAHQPGHPDNLRTIAALAELRYRQGDRTAAAKILGDEEHPTVLQCRLTVGKMLLATDDPETKRFGLEGLYESLAASPGTQHPATRETLDLTIDTSLTGPQHQASAPTPLR